MERQSSGFHSGHTWKRVISFCMALAMILALIPGAVFTANAAAGDKLYFVPGDQWGSDGAWYAAYFFGSGEKWVAMADADGDGYYECTIPTGGYTHVIFCRMNPASTALSWDNKWNQTADLTLSNSKNCFTMSNSTQWNEKATGTWSSYTPVTEEPEETTTPTSATTPSTPSTGTRNVIVHYRNLGLWSSVYSYVWDLDSENTLNGGWPGKVIPATTGHTNWYTLTLKDVQTSSIGIVFNNNAGSQTSDIKIENIPAAGGEYWYDGALTTSAPSTWADGSVASVSCDFTLHFVDNKGWNNVSLYTWTDSGTPTGSWPGTKTGVDNDGFHTLSFTAKVPEGQKLNFIFNNGGNGCQTVDLSISAADVASGKVERWIQPTTEYVDDDPSTAKFNCDIFNNAGYVAMSPVIDGTSVTFEYANASASSVLVYGSMNDWGTGYSMTKNSYGVWSVTVKNVAPGNHTYKFVVDGTWITDPCNSWIVNEDNGNSNSAFMILDPNAVDNNKVTVKIHYTRSDFTNWNVWVWSLNQEAAQYEFVPENGERVATIEVVGRGTQYLSFIPRKSVGENKWAAQEYGERQVSLTDIVSGTVHFYITEGQYSGTMVLGTDVVKENKVVSVELDYTNNKIIINTVKMVSGDPMDAFKIVDTTDANSNIAITSIEANGSTYTLSVNKELDLVNLYKYKINFLDQKNYKDYPYDIQFTHVYATDRFAEEFTYYGGDLGATWTSQKTTFKVWAPSAVSVDVMLYATGSDAEAGAANLGKYAMTRGDKGVWTVQIQGDLNSVYYTYRVNVNGDVVEACDPYARTTGVNGKRSMVVDLDSTDPAGWETDANPNPLASYTDAVIYELHVRDFSIDDSSGVSEANRGKFMAFTESGTTVNGQGKIPTGIDYLNELGVTHLHLLPIYDYASVDETKCDSFNWGYDPQNYNVPEGSYSTNPYDGNVRVKEMKQMVQSLHNNGISVIMDVVYNHVYDAGKFPFNQVVPNYFSRQNDNGSFSNGSGCGNDTASEREMVRDYIVASIMYWKEEYHIDGFRFDLVGLLDATTINQIVDTVHAKYPDVIFYGEGWTMGTAVEPGNTMATQANSAATPEFAYFSDTIRNLLGGENGKSTGYVSGSTGKEEDIANNFMAKPWWTNNPKQVIQYASCHDNYTLADKIILSTGKSGIDSEVMKMSKLAGAVYMTAQGVPFIHAGEEFYREKLEEDGGRCENSYNAPDSVNHIEWSNLTKSDYAAGSAYYKGLVEFRKNHAALRLATSAEIAANVKYTWVSANTVMFTINGGINGEVADKIVVIFNANKNAVNVSLPSGSWKVCIDGENAGTDVLYTKSGSVSVAGISAMVLVQGETKEAHSHKYTAKVTAPTCTEQGYTTFTCSCGHTYKANYVDAAGHNYVDGTCGTCGAADPDYVEPVKGTITLKGTTLSLEEEILYNLYFSTSDMDVAPENMGMLVFNSQPTNVSVDTANQKVDGALVSGSMYMVSTLGISGKNLGDTVYLVAYAKLDNGQYVYSSVLPYSAKSYCFDRLEKSTNANLKALCVAILNYGAAAQEYFAATSDYTYTTLMNADLTAAQKALVKAYSADMVAARGTVTAAKAGTFGTTSTATGFSGLGATMSADGIFSINYYFTTSTAASNVTMYYWTAADFAKVSTLTKSNATGSKAMTATGKTNQFWGSIDGIAAKDLDKTVYVCGVYTVGGTTYTTGVIAYSLGYYCVTMAASGSATMKPMAAATAVYGYYAKNYFNA